MKTNAFHWSLELPKVKAEAERLAKIAAPGRRSRRSPGGSNRGRPAPLSKSGDDGP